MENFFKILISNPSFNVAFVSWFVAQFIKLFVVLLTERRFDILKFLDSGGMPSSHTAFVVSLAVSVAKICGIESTQFAIALAFACIVMYDAAGIRRAAGEQAKILNQMMESWEDNDRAHLQKELKELLGHTPFQVFAGAVLGFIIAFIM